MGSFLRCMDRNPCGDWHEHGVQPQLYSAFNKPPQCLSGTVVKFGAKGQQDFMAVCEGCAEFFMRRNPQEDLERKAVVRFHEPTETARRVYRRDVDINEAFRFAGGLCCPFQAAGTGVCSGLALWPRPCSCAKRVALVAAKAPEK